MQNPQRPIPPVPTGIGATPTLPRGLEHAALVNYIRALLKFNWELEFQTLEESTNALRTLAFLYMAQPGLDPTGEIWNSIKPADHGPSPVINLESSHG